MCRLNAGGITVGVWRQEHEMSQSRPPGSGVGSVAYQLGDFGKLPNMYVTGVVCNYVRIKYLTKVCHLAALSKRQLFSFLSEPASQQQQQIRMDAHVTTVYLWSQQQQEAGDRALPSRYNLGQYGFLALGSFPFFSAYKNPK